MTTGATGQLGLALPVQGELSGTWGDTVNNGITQYTNIAIAGTLTLTGDGAVTLTNTTGDASASNITSSLTGAGTVTAQFAIVKIAGTLTTTKVVTFGSVSLAPYSKTFMVVNAATGGTVTFKAYGQTGVSIAVGESAWVYYNGTDIVKIAGTVITPAGSTTQVQYNNAGALAGSANFTFDGTNVTLGGGTANGVTYLNGSKVLTSGSALTFDGTNLVVGEASGGLVDIDGTSGATALRIRQTTAGAGTEFTTTITENTGVTFDSTDGGTTARSFIWTQVGAEQMRLTSNGLGIGRTPVAYSSFKVLDVAGSTGAIQKWVHTGSTVELQAYASSGLTGIGSATNHPLILVTNDTERARIDTAGYLSGVWADEVSALGNSGTAKTITCTAGNVFTATLTGNCTFTLSAPSTTTANTATSFTLILTNDATAGRTVAWAGGTFLFPGGAASLSRTTTANATDVWFFFSPNGGTTWYGSIPMKNLTA